jgi:hypothetical protein
VAAADLNGDGYPELVFANQGVEAGLESISKKVGLESYIYWGSATGFDPEKPGLVPTLGAVDVAIADCNGDGRLDLADLGCFTTNFNLGLPAGDCNRDGALNLSDFGCFQTKYTLGCP